MCRHSAIKCNDSFFPINEFGGLDERGVLDFVCNGIWRLAKPCSKDLEHIGMESKEREFFKINIFV